MLLALLSARIHCINPKFWEVYGFVVANSLFIGSKPCSRPCFGEDAVWLFGAQKGAETKRRLGLTQGKETDNERIRTAAAEAIRFRGVPVNHSGTLPYYWYEKDGSLFRLLQACVDLALGRRQLKGGLETSGDQRFLLLS